MEKDKSRLIDDIHFEKQDVRIHNVLKANFPHIKTIDDLNKIQISDFRRLRNFGEESLYYLSKLMKEYGVKFSDIPEIESLEREIDLIFKTLIELNNEFYCKFSILLERISDKHAMLLYRIKERK